MSYVFRCKQFVWMINVSKITCKWLKMETDMSIFDEEFTKNYDENSNKGHILGADVEYPKDLHDLHSYL